MNTPPEDCSDCIQARLIADHGRRLGEHDTAIGSSVTDRGLLNKTVALIQLDMKYIKDTLDSLVKDFRDYTLIKPLEETKESRRFNKRYWVNVIVMGISVLITGILIGIIVDGYTKIFIK